jgi:hypothetical protein
MTLYLLAVHGVEGDPVPDEATMQQMFEAVDKFNKKIVADGSWVFGGGLEPIKQANVVRAHEGETVVSDGPFIKGDANLGGFWIVRLPNIDAALALAAEASAACQSPVEVRPFQGDTE